MAPHSQMQAGRGQNMQCAMQVEGAAQVAVAREVPKKDPRCRLTTLIAPKMASFCSFLFAPLLPFVAKFAVENMRNCIAQHAALL